MLTFVLSLVFLSVNLATTAATTTATSTSFPSPPDASADRVYGQGSDFTTGDSNKGGRSAFSLNWPMDLALDATGGLYVADDHNHRVLYFGPEAAATATATATPSVTSIAGALATITGTVRYGGRPLSEFTNRTPSFWAWNEELNEYISLSPTYDSATGHYTLSSMAPGNYRIGVWVDADGAWMVSLPPRRPDLQAYFDYSNGDRFRLAVEGARRGTLVRHMSVGEPRPIQLSLVPGVAVQAGWTLLALPDREFGPYTAESLLAELVAQGIDAAQVARWQDGRWESHVRGFPANPFPVEPGRGYFVRSSNYGTWTPRGRP